jgi:hypothetical protein
LWYIKIANLTVVLLHAVPPCRNRHAGFYIARQRRSTERRVARRPS